MLARYTNPISTYNPWHAMDEFEKRMFGEPFAELTKATGNGIFKTDIKEIENGFELEADLPGFKKEDIQLDVDGDILTITAERHSKHEDEDEQGKYVRCERSYGKYSRQFEISAVDSEKITASYEDGVLKLVMPKKEALIPKKLGIQIQ